MSQEEPRQTELADVSQEKSQPSEHRSGEIHEDSVQEESHFRATENMIEEEEPRSEVPYERGNAESTRKSKPMLDAEADTSKATVDGTQIGSQVRASESQDGKADRLSFFDTLRVASGFLAALFIMICLVLAYKSFNKKFFHFDVIQESWRKEAVLDFKMAVNGTCPTNYTEAMSFVWPGAAEGCDCTENTGEFRKAVYRSKCVGDMVSRGCHPSPNLESRLMQKWRFPEAICELRANGVNMETMVNRSLAANNDCAEGFMLCPPSPTGAETGKTDHAWSMCVPRSLGRCPITEVRLSKCSFNPNPACFKPTPEDKLPLNGTEAGDCLWKSHTCGRGPINQLAMGEYSLCRKEKDHQIAPGHQDNPLLKKTRKPCLANENTVLIDSESQKQVFENNNVPFKLVRGFEREIEHLSFNLYQVYYTKWAWDTRDPSDVDLVFNNRLHIEKLEDLHKTSIMYFTFSVFIFVFVAPALVHFEYEHEDLYEEFPQLRVGAFLVKWFFRLSAVPVIHMITRYNEAIWRKYRQYSASGFSNEYENGRISEISQSLESGIYIFDRVALWIAVTAILAEVVLLVLIWVENRRLSLRGDHEEPSVQQSLSGAKDELA